MLLAVENAARCFLDGVGEYKRLWIGSIDEIAQFPEFHAGDDGKNNVNVGTDVELARQKAAFSFVNRNASSQVVHKLKLDQLAFSGNDRDPGKGL